MTWVTPACPQGNLVKVITREFYFEGRFPDISRANVTDHILYRRPNRSSMQFYSFDSRELDILPLQTSRTLSCRTPTVNLSIIHDYTRPKRPPLPTLDDLVLKHVCRESSLS